MAVPKTRIHAAPSSNKRVRERFTAQIARSSGPTSSPETLHLPARHGIAEIQVSSLHMKSDAAISAV